MQNHLGENGSNLHLKRAAYRFCIEISLCEDVNWNHWKLWIHQKFYACLFFYLPCIYRFFTLAHGTTVLFTTSEFNVNTDSSINQTSHGRKPIPVFKDRTNALPVTALFATGERAVPGISCQCNQIWSVLQNLDLYKSNSFDGSSQTVRDDDAI